MVRWSACRPFPYEVISCLAERRCGAPWLRSSRWSIVRHQRESASNRGFRHLAGYIQGRDTKPRATWFHAANLPGVVGRDDLELACKLVDAIQAQNTRAGSKRTYHLVVSLGPDDRRLERKELQQTVERLVDTLGFSEHQYIAARHDDTDHEHIHVAINKIHPETFRIHSPAWDHQKLFTGARALERELGLTAKFGVHLEPDGLRGSHVSGANSVDRNASRWKPETRVGLQERKRVRFFVVRDITCIRAAGAIVLTRTLCREMVTTFLARREAAFLGPTAEEKWTKWEAAKSQI